MKLTYPIVQDDLCKTFGVPEQLVDIVITNDFMMILFSSHELAVDHLVPLIAHEAIERLNGALEVKSFGYRVNPILAIRTSIVVVRALEDEAQALGREAHVSRLGPAQQPERNLPQAIVLAHVVHRIAPAIERAVERLGARRLYIALDTAQPLQTRVLRLSHSIIEVELRSKVPFAVVGMLTTDIVRMNGNQRLVGRHTRRARVEKLHEEVELGEILTIPFIRL